MYTDPSGHQACDDGDLDGVCNNPLGGEGGSGNGGNGDDVGGGGLGDSLNNSNDHQSNPLQVNCDGLFGTLEGSTCSNVNQALNTLSNPNATASQKFWSGYYVTVVGNTHAAIVVGLSIAAWQLITGAGTVCATNPECTNTFIRTITESQITGTKGNIINISGFQQTVINGVTYSGHAVDRMLQNGITPKVIEGVMQYESSVGNTIITQVFYDPVNNIRVVQNTVTGIIVTLGYGIP